MWIRPPSCPQTEQIGNAPSSGASVMTLCVRVSDPTTTSWPTGTTRAKGKYGLILSSDIVSSRLSVKGAETIPFCSTEGPVSTFFYLPATKSTKNHFITGQ